jgi:hypothetical protein
MNLAGDGYQEPCPISDCSIVGCSADDGGAGLSFSTAVDLAISRLTLSQCRGTLYGSAMVWFRYYDIAIPNSVEHMICDRNYGKDCLCEWSNGRSGCVFWESPFVAITDSILQDNQGIPFYREPGSSAYFDVFSRSFDCPLPQGTSLFHFTGVNLWWCHLGFGQFVVNSFVYEAYPSAPATRTARNAGDTPTGLLLSPNFSSGHR